MPDLKVTGKVKWFDDAKGYGFISYHGTDYFVHYKQIKMEGHRTLTKGQRVTFTASQKDGKSVALDVEVEVN